MTAWKDLERRVCRALGGERYGNRGASVSDCVGVPFAVEIKRSSRPGPPVLSKWILQARDQSRREHKPWLVVVAGHNDRRPVVALDFFTFVYLAQQAGVIPGVIPTPPDDAAENRVDNTVENHHTPRMTDTIETPDPPAPDPEPDPEPDNGDDGDDGDDGE